MSYRNSKKPPRGYYQQQYPLPHNFNYDAHFNVENETLNSCIFTLFRTSKKAVNPEAVEVNPAHASFAEDTGPLVHLNSIVPKISMRLDLNLEKFGIETDKVRQLKVIWFPIYIAFLDSLEAEDLKTAVQIEDILELQHDTINRDTYPLHSGTDISHEINHPMSTVPFAEIFSDYGLSVDVNPETVALDMELVRDARQYYTNRGMLGKVMGKMHYVTLVRDRPYKYFSNNFTYPSVL